MIENNGMRTQAALQANARLVKSGFVRGCTPLFLGFSDSDRSAYCTAG